MSERALRRDGEHLRPVEGDLPSAAEIERYLEAYLATVPPTGRSDWRTALAGFEALFEQWRQQEVGLDAVLPAVLEAATRIAERHGYPVGALLSELAQRGHKATVGDGGTGSTRRRILDAAYYVFARKGFYEATVDEIAEAAGVGKGTVYRHFEAKENLFRQVVEDRLQELLRRIKEAFQEDGDILGNIRRGIHVYLAFYEEHKEFYRILSYEQQGFGAEFKAAYIDGILRNVPAIREQVIAAFEAGQLKPLDDFYTIFYGLVGFVDGVIQKWFRNGCQGALVDELDTIIETLFYGFAKPKATLG